jgi:hypothetical protein
VIVNADRRASLSDFAETWRGAAPRGLRRLVAALLAAGVLAAGCSQPEEAVPEWRLAVCVAPTAERKAGDRVKIEFRQGGTLVASASIQVGGVFSGLVPAGPEVEVYADGSLVGTSSSPDNYLRGEGCPQTATG